MARFVYGGWDDDAEIVSIPCTLDETVAAGDILRPFVGGAYGLLRKCGDTHSHAIGIAATAGNAGDTIDMLQQGKASVTFAHSISSADVGKAVYVSSTTGQATTTAPSASGSYVIHLGWLQSDDGTCLIDPKTINYNS